MSVSVSCRPSGMQMPACFRCLASFCSSAVILSHGISEPLASHKRNKCPKKLKRAQWRCRTRVLQSKSVAGRLASCHDCRSGKRRRASVFTLTHSNECNKWVKETRKDRRSAAPRRQSCWPRGVDKLGALEGEPLMRHARHQQTHDALAHMIAHAITLPSLWLQILGCRPLWCGGRLRFRSQIHWAGGLGAAGGSCSQCSPCGRGGPQGSDNPSRPGWRAVPTAAEAIQAGRNHQAQGSAGMRGQL
jgi:hypothetical protein